MDDEVSVELARVRWHLAALRFEHAMLRHAVALRRLKYDPNQPRVPAGSSAGGQWTSQQSSVDSEYSSARRTSQLAAECLSQLSARYLSLQHGRSKILPAQAALRYANCLSGLPVPPLNYRGVNMIAKRMLKLQRDHDVFDIALRVYTPEGEGAFGHVAMKSIGPKERR